MGGALSPARAVRAALLALAVAGAGFGAAPLGAQSPSPRAARPTSRDVLRLLGLPDTARLVIIHADDAAITPGASFATLEALRTRGVSSASVMATTPHLHGFVAALPPGARYDLGVHLTVVSETRVMRWPSVAPAAQVPSLLDEDGMLRIGLREDLAAPEIERELEAQVARVRASGIPLTHLDAHQGALLYHGAARFEALRRVARKHCLAIPVPESFFGRFPYLADALDDGQLPLADLMSIDADTPPAQWEAAYVRLFATMRPGVTLLLVHLGVDAPEERAAFGGHDEYDVAWRVRDAALARAGALREMARWHGIRVIDWRDLARIARLTPPGTPCSP